MNKERKILIALKISIQIVIAIILSFAITIINYGYSGFTIQQWIKGGIIAFIIIPLALKLIPLISKFFISFIGHRSVFFIKCIVATCVAMMMEGMISFVITIAQRGFEGNWFVAWLFTFIQALPVGLFIGFSMTFIVQPFMQTLSVNVRKKPNTALEYTNK